MKKWLFLLCIVFLLFPLKVQASESNGEIQEYWMSEFLDMANVNQIDYLLKDIFPDNHVTFTELLELLLNAEKTVSAEKVVDFIADLLFKAIRKNKNAIVFLFGLSIVSAVFSNFANVFQSKQVSSIGFYIVYLLMISVCLQAFRLTMKDIEISIEHLLTFMEIFSPIYFISMAISVGSISSIVFYNIVIVLIYGVELVIFRLLLPLVNVYLIMQILNYLSEEDVLSKSSDLIKTFVEWSLKFLLAAVTGISLVESILAPAIDTVKRNGLIKGVEMIPGLGDMIGGTGEMFLGVAVLVKNGIGAAGSIVIIAICLIPVINMLVVSFSYKCMAAVIQPLAEKKFTETIYCLGEGCFLLLKIQVAVAILFLITIGVAVKATS